MLTCKELVEKIGDYLDGNMGLMDRLGLRMHLMMCGHCSTYYAQMRQMLDALHALPPGHLPPDFEMIRAAVLAALDAEPEGSGGPR
ncbi:MAG: hypothetical protein AMXMBFR64_01720 [Myxococcales bacterium]